MEADAPLFATPRLLARPLEPDDLDAMAAVYGDAEAMRFVGDGEPLDRGGCRRWIDVTARNYATRGYGMAALVLRDSGRVIGFCGLVHPGGQPEAELKYALRREAWGQGLASEAAAAMLTYGAETLGLRRIIATVAPAHGASRRVLEKAGLHWRVTRRAADGEETAVYEWRAGPAS